jgi:hypothetical protein
MKKHSSVNYGIQADVIQASALAVGPRARATAAADGGDKGAVLGQLAEAIKQLQLDSVKQQLVLEHLDSMRTEPAHKNASTFDKIVSAIKAVGHAAELIVPMKAVAMAFGLPIPF